MEDVPSSSEAIVVAQALEAHDHAKKSIIGGSLIYTILGYSNSFGNIAMYVVSYMNSIGKDPTVNYQNISSIYAVAVLLQSLCGFFCSKIEASVGARKMTIIGCTTTSISIILAAACLRNYAKFMFFYSIVGGIASGLVLPLPLDAVIKLNPHRRGFSCGCIFFASGAISMLLCPLQTLYINREGTRLHPDISPDGTESYYDSRMLDRLPAMFALMGFLYLFILVVTIDWVFPRPMEGVSSVKEVQKYEYESFATIRDESLCISEDTGGSRYRKYCCLWFLMYLSWQSVIYMQSYWKIVAILKLDASDFVITLIGTVATCANVIGRVIWGIVFDSFGWKGSWMVLSLTALCLTICLSPLFKQYMLAYGMWVTTIFFVHAGLFSIGPMTAHRLFGSKKFTMTAGFLNTARALAGLTAMFFSSYKLREFCEAIPITISAISLVSLVVICLLE